MLRRAALLVLASLLAFTPPVLASHVQTDSGNPIVFRSQGGNEWWVQVQISGGGAGVVVAMEAADTNGPWVAMGKHYEWGFGVWATSFRVEPGHDVRFRATWSGGAQQVSCWFTHPAGAEKCGNPPPPPPGGPWVQRTIGSAPDGFWDLAVADADRDGRSELYGTSFHGLFRMAPGLGAQTTVSSLPSWGHIAAGDGDNDGKQEVYANHFNDAASAMELHRLSWSGSAWTDQVIATGWGLSGPLTLGDLDRDGLRELYVVGEEGGDVFVTQVAFRGGMWQAQRIATYTVDSTYGVSPQHVWIGDADRDGQAELVFNAAGKPGPFIFMLDRTVAGWALGVVANEHSNSLVAGDADGDGLGEIVLINSSGEVRFLVWTGSTWVSSTVATVPMVGDDLFLADGDNDGKQELYAAQSAFDTGAHAYQLRAGAPGAPWAVTEVGTGVHDESFVTRLIVGDADGDGANEVLMATFSTEGDGHVTQFKWLPPAAFDASFTAVRGNEWWVQANVATTGGTLSKVDVSLNGGAWKPLTKQSWGGWAASYHIPQGTVVQLRATSTTGATDLSSCRQWVPPSNQDAQIVPCGQQPPPGFDATFTGVKGNEWWVQANVAANQPLAGIDARVNCGTWTALTLQSWGGWAKSFHVPNGAKVDFRARSTSGATDLSGGYIWPNATPTTGC